MAEEDVESLRRGNDALNRGDKATWLTTIDPDAVMIPAHDWPEKALVRGAEAIWDFYDGVTAAWEEAPFELAEVTDCGAGTVAANVRREVRGKTSGVGVNFSYWLVVTNRKGRAVRIEWFADRAEALEAAGLSEY